MANDKTQYLTRDKDGKGHLPYTDASGKIDHGKMGGAWAALHGGYRGQKYQGPNKEQALAKLKKLYKEEKMEFPSEKAAAAINHLALLKSGDKDNAPKKFITFAIKSVRESPADDPEPGLFVEGILAGEQVDFEGEIMDYKSSKPNFQKWNKSFIDATGGKSVGNLRGQHNSRIAAGKFVEMNYDDAALSIPVTAKVIDPIEQEKVREGVYTSFSVGAHYARKWRDGNHTRWTADPFEGSLVDFGAIPMTRGFTYRAADGTVEEREFDGGRRLLRKAFEATGRNLAVDEEERVVKAITSMAAARKGLYTISGFAQLIQELIYLRDSITFEREMEGDDSPVTDRVAEATEELLECLASYTQEQVSEEIGKSDSKEKTVDIEELTKDRRVKAAAADPAESKPTNDEVQKALVGINDALTVLKAAGYVKQPGTDPDPGHSMDIGPGKTADKCDKTKEDCKDAVCPMHGTKSKAAGCDKTKEECKDADCATHKCMKSAENCDDEKCMTHKGKKSAAVGANGDVALKASDVHALINDRMRDFKSEISTELQKAIGEPLGEQLKAIGDAVRAIAGEPVPTAIKARAGLANIGKDDEANKAAQDAQKSITDDVKAGRTVDAVLKIRGNGGVRVGV